MKTQEVNLMLPQHSIFLVACLELGRFFSRDATFEESLSHLHNICELRLKMNEKYLKEFIVVAKKVESKKEILQEKGEKLFDRTFERLKDIFEE